LVRRARGERGVGSSGDGAYIRANDQGERDGERGECAGEI
jgi:hypothetical protein